MRYILIVLELTTFQKKQKNSYTKKISTNIYRIQPYDSIMSKYFCTGFNNFMLKDKNLPEYTNLQSPNEHEKNFKIILKYFQQPESLNFSTAQS